MNRTDLIDGRNRIVLGEVVSRPHENRAAAEDYLTKLAGTNLRADVRFGKDGQWFAVLVTGDERTVLSSENIGDRDKAKAAAQNALRLLKA